MVRHRPPLGFPYSAPPPPRLAVQAPQVWPLVLPGVRTGLGLQEEIVHTAHPQAMGNALGSGGGGGGWLAWARGRRGPVQGPARDSVLRRSILHWSALSWGPEGLPGGAGGGGRVAPAKGGVGRASLHSPSTKGMTVDASAL